MNNRRQSNMELLRIVAMLLVLVVHADFYSLGKPSYGFVHADELSGFLRFLTQSISIVCVNLFVLLSGWFGIYPKIKSVSSYLFCCLFTFFCIYLLMVATGNEALTGYDFINGVMLYRVNWFIYAYLGLYIFAPVLNAFVESAGKRLHGAVVLSFIVFQTILGWATSYMTDFISGYSLISLIGLYLLARYVRLYPLALFSKGKGFDMIMYVALTLLTATVAFCITYFVANRAVVLKNVGLLYAYNSPLVISAAMFLLLFFSKLQIGQSRFINWIAASSFAVFLIHTNIYLFPYYSKCVVYITHSYSILPFIFVILAFIIAVFVVCILFDQLRIKAWNYLWRLLERVFIKKEG